MKVNLLDNQQRRPALTKSADGIDVSITQHDFNQTEDGDASRLENQEENKTHDNRVENLLGVTVLAGEGYDYRDAVQVMMIDAQRFIPRQRMRDSDDLDNNRLDFSQFSPPERSPK